CRRVFQAEFTKALARADRVVLPAVFRSNLPEEERLSPEAIVRDLREAGVDARYVPEIPEIVRTVAREARESDLVIVMSNGGFDGIYQKLLLGLRLRAPRRVES